MSDMSIVVRRTFFEIQDNAEEIPCRRGRAFSDTILDRYASDVDADCEKASDHSTSTGSCVGDLSSVGSQFGDDDTPRSCESDVWADEVEATGISVSSPVPFFWMPMSVAPLAQLGRMVAPGANVTHAPETSHRLPNKQVDTRRTIMLRNLPSSFTRAALFEILEDRGFSGRFDFVYVPIDFTSGACLGYAFVNLLDHETAELAISSLRGFEEWQGTCSQKTMDACWSDPHQGTDMLVERFRNSRVMHGLVPDEYKPALFQDGVRVPFPKSTKRIRPPFSGGVRTKASCA